jgi:amino acid adenylation domain-containing protein
VKGICIHELIEAQVSASPQALALVADDETGRVAFTYTQLNQRANRLAHRLREAGVGPERRVGVCLHRGIDMMVTLLAILKAGGAYVPFEPDCPPERLTYMLTDSAVPVLVTDRALAPALPQFPGTLMFPDDVPGPEDALESAVHPANTAYVMYTSGSTGRPKGVVVPHAGVVNRLQWGQEWFGYDGTDRVLQKTPYTFDVSVPELFGPLAAGAAVVMARAGGHRDPAYLTGVINRERITTVHFVPSMLRAFLEETTGPLPSLRRMMCSGEALTDDLATAVHQRLGCELFNLYGPTEASVEVTGLRCLPGQPVTIGHAVPGTAVYVLDEELAPVPDLAEGQLCLAGVQLARGYHGQAALTADRFVPDPLADAPGQRLYLTGDRVRRLPDGAVEYLGRLDQQVKIRGNRVELGEIEAALVEDPAVSAAAVALSSSTSDTRLVAHLVPAGSFVDIDEVRQRLMRRLPAYMVPTTWTVLASMPLTSSGKIDRRALPDTGSRRPEQAGPYVAPRTDTEAVLVGVWEEILGVSPVGIRDNFYDLGGHSLSATSICARARRLVDVELSVGDLLTTMTVEGFAAVVAERGAAADSVVPVLAQELPGARHQLSFAQQRLWLLDQMSPGSSDYNMYEGYRLVGDIDVDALRGALDDVLRRHTVLRATFHAAGGVPYQQIADAVQPPLHTAVATGEAELRAVVDREVHRPFQLAEGPPLRLVLIRQDAARHVLLLVMHHIVTDDWSMEVLWRDLSARYSARLHGSATPPAAPAARYVDYAAWQRRNLQGAALAEHLGYWRKQLDGAPVVLELPADLPRTEHRGGGDSLVTFAVPRGASDALTALARREAATPFMVLLAAFAALINATTGREDMLVGTFTGNRTTVETEQMVGLFVNTLPIRARCDGNPTFTELLHRVRAGALGAYRHQELPFDRIVGLLRPPRDLTRTPVVQVGFQTLGAPTQRVVLPGVTVEPLLRGQGGNALDVLLSIYEGGDSIAGELHYRDDLFTAATARALADRYAAIVAAVVTDPQLRLSDLR